MSDNTDVPQATTDIFGVPLGSMGGALVPYEPPAAPPVAARRSTLPPAIRSPAETTSPVDQQDVNAERDRLLRLRLCRSLNRADKCPGRCVFTGELRAPGTAVFRAMTDGGA